MAILLYANGLTEEFKPQLHNFTDSELLGIFSEFDSIRTYRLYELANTWCVWGENNPPAKKKDEFSQIGSDILEQPCYSPILFVHDTEINPAWLLTDSVIITGYVEFKAGMLVFFDEIAADIIKERDEMRVKSGQTLDKLMVLEQTGISADKRIIFTFDLDKQSKEFFTENNLSEFANRVLNFLKFSYKDGDIFATYADKHIIMVIKDKQVKDFVNKVVAFFESKENYEACSVLRNTYDRWSKFKQAKKIDSKKDQDPDTKNEK